MNVNLDGSMIHQSSSTKATVATVTCTGSRKESQPAIVPVPTKISLRSEYYQTAIRLGNVGVHLLGQTRQCIDGNLDINNKDKDKETSVLATELIKHSIDSIKRVTDERSVISLQDVECIKNQYKQAITELVVDVLPTTAPTPTPTPTPNPNDECTDAIRISDNSIEDDVVSYEDWYDDCEDNVFCQMPVSVSYTNPNVDCMKAFFVDEDMSSLCTLLFVSLGSTNLHCLDQSQNALKLLHIKDVQDLTGEDPEEIDYISAVLLHNIGISYVSRSMNVSVSLDSSYNSNKLLKVGCRLLELSLKTVEDQICRNTIRRYDDGCMVGDNDFEEFEEGQDKDTSCCDDYMHLLSLLLLRCLTLSSLYYVGLRLSDDEKFVDENDVVILTSIQEMMYYCTDSIYEMFTLVQGLFRDPRFIVTTSRSILLQANCHNAPAA